MRALPILLGATLVWAGSAGAAGTSGTSRDAAKVIAATRATRATYSLYLWTVITRAGEPVVEEWSAEFHKGVLHRVETPRDRIIANCATMTGTYLRVETGETYSGASVARAACGIDANSPVLSASVTGRVKTRFGTATNLRIVGDPYVRTYSVLATGALVAATMTDRLGNLLLSNRAAALEPTVPDDIFSVQSLSRSAVPAKYKARSSTS